MITVVSKCKNESNNISKMILSVLGFADRVLIVDDSSEDDTVAIARSLGAHVLNAEVHNGFIDLLDKQGFLAVDSGWILRMDADERLTPELAEKLFQLSKIDSVDGVVFARLNILFGKSLRHGGWFESNRMGFFRTESWNRDWKCEIHSQVPVKGRIVVIPKNEAHMIHDDYQNISQFIERTLHRYSEVESRERNIQFRSWQLFYGPSRKFLGRFILRKGFKDGLHGLVIALLLAMYECLILLQVWDRQKGVSRENSDD